MPRYRVALMFEGANVNSVSKKAKEFFGGDAETAVTKVTQPTSRADRLSEAESMVGDAKSIVEELRDELQEWLDNLPENLQSGTKAEELESAIGGLDEIAGNLEDVDFGPVDFPGMF